MDHSSIVYTAQVYKSDAPNLDDARQKVGAPPPRPALKGDIRVVLYANEAVAGTVVLNVGFAEDAIDQHVGYLVALPLDGIPRPYISVSDAWVVDGDWGLFLILLQVILKVASRTQFWGGLKVMYVMGTGPCVQFGFMFLEKKSGGKLKSRLHPAAPGQSPVESPLTGLSWTDFDSALAYLADAERGGRFPSLENEEEVIQAIVLDGAMVRMHIDDGVLEPAGDGLPVINDE